MSEIVSRLAQRHLEFRCVAHESLSMVFGQARQEALNPHFEAESDAKKLRADLEALWSTHNRGGDELTVFQSEYLEVIAVKA